MRDTASPPLIVKSADRVLTLFELLGGWRREMSHVEIVERLGIPKSSLTQLLKNMVGRGWLTYSPASKGYSLGPAFSRLARRVSETSDLVSAAGPILAELTTHTAESSALNVLKGDVAEVASTVMGPHRLVSHMRLGDVAPLYAISGGKAILAFLPGEMQDDYFRRVKFEGTTPNTIRSAKVLRMQLREIQQNGIAYVQDEWTHGITGMARPILSQVGEVLASINVAIPSVRFDDSLRVRASEALLRATDAIRMQLLQG